MLPQDVLDFWFKELTLKEQFGKDPELDQTIKEKFLTTHQQIVAGETYSWRDTIHGRLAEIIVLDQFSRNIFRNQKESFSYDSLALILAEEAIKQPDLDQLSIEEKAFLYLPFMHSESDMIHQQAQLLFAEPGLETFSDYEDQHYAIIKRFGRYPHRNNILGRESTPEEIEFLKGPNSSF